MKETKVKTMIEATYTITHDDENELMENAKRISEEMLYKLMRFGISNGITFEIETEFPDGEE